MTVLVIGWLALVSTGLCQIWTYDNNPDELVPAPASWPDQQSFVHRSSGTDTMLVFIHPMCACSRATLRELQRSVAARKVSVDIHIFLFVPAGASADWQESANWSLARAVDNATLHADKQGQVASAFSVTSSGQVLYYDTNGVLQYSGGITASRGHEGRNRGLDAINALITGNRPDCSQQSVFGCRISSDAMDNRL